MVLQDNFKYVTLNTQNFVQTSVKRVSYKTKSTTLQKMILNANIWLQTR